MQCARVLRMSVRYGFTFVFYGTLCVSSAADRKEETRRRTLVRDDHRESSTAGDCYRGGEGRAFIYPVEEGLLGSRAASGEKVLLSL